jgi:hypothetical protein
VSEAAIRTDLAATYLPLVLAEVPRLLSQLDREPFSPTAGNFDREWWAWKFRDHPVVMLQAGLLPLSLLWAHALPGNPYHRNERLLGWLEQGVAHSLGLQRPGGAFDSVGPNTQDHGVTLLMAYSLCRSVSLIGPAFPDALRSRVADAVRRACRFAASSSEDYAFISNHHALFALAWLEAQALTGERAFRENADAETAAILSHQSPDGWYLEYGGPDPGYESLGIHYLARVWRHTQDANLLASLRRSIEFFTHAVHPDGSVGGVYGSRCTSLYMPGGFELCAAHDANAAAVAGFMRARLAAANVVTPQTSDNMNLPILLGSYLDACLSGGTSAAAAAPLPFERDEGVRKFTDAGLITAATHHYYAVVSSKRGGVIRVFDRQRATLAYQDAGYLVTTTDSRRWTSQGEGTMLPSGDAEAACDSQFALFNPVVATPGAFLLLRALQLTLFRSRRIGAWLRRRIVGRLITKRQLGPLRLVRRFKFLDARVEISDRLERKGVQVSQVALAPALTPIHMGSARYYHPSELDAGPRPAIESLTAQLSQGGDDGIAETGFAIVFGAEAATIHESGSN